MEKVYIESSIPSYLVQKTNRDAIIADKQNKTKQWWEQESAYFDLYISTTVLDEISVGNQIYAVERLKLVAHLPVLDVTPEMFQLARQLSDKLNFLPAKAWVDLVHISVALLSGIDYLLTWNCKHIANGQVMRWINRWSLEQGRQPLVIVTPYELMLKSGEEDVLDE